MRENAAGGYNISSGTPFEDSDQAIPGRAELIEILRRHEKLMDALNRAAVIFMSQNNDNFDEMMASGVSLLAGVADFDEVSVWRNFTADDGMHTSQFYRWRKDHGGAAPLQTELLDVSYNKALPGLEVILRQNQPVNGPVRLLPGTEVLGSYGTRSLFLTPVFIGNDFWGGMLFEDEHCERHIEEDLAGVLRCASFLCVNAIIRSEMERDLKTALAKEIAASKAKGEFLSNMSHEMRTPLNAIIGMTAIGRGTRDMERKDYALGKVEDASKFLLGMINDILDMSKIESGKLELSYSGFDFEQMLKNIVSVINFKVEEKRQRFMVDVDSRIPRYIVSDEQRLSQVVTNLLSNAVKFTQKGGEISLIIDFVSEKDDIVELRVEVGDSGIGISSEQQEKLFDAFSQAESGISRKYGGTGLGLAISKRIVELMGGDIWVSSQLGKGSRFIFTVKAARDNDPGAFTQDDEEGSGAADEPEINLAGRNILIVEDIDINLEILISLLDGTGIIIDTASNGREAIKMVEAAPSKYDLIFMDVQMPEMDGIEATRHIRALKLKRGTRLPIIAMTANVFKDDIENCIMAGMDNHIGKPLDIKEVMHKLRQYIKYAKKVD